VLVAFATTTLTLECGCVVVVADDVWWCAVVVVVVEAPPAEVTVVGVLLAVVALLGVLTLGLVPTATRTATAMAKMRRTAPARTTDSRAAVVCVADVGSSSSMP